MKPVTEKRFCIYCDTLLGCNSLAPRGLKLLSCEDCTLTTGEKIDCKFAFVKKDKKVAGVCQNCLIHNEEAIDDVYAEQFQ